MLYMCLCARVCVSVARVCVSVSMGVRTRTRKIPRQPTQIKRSINEKREARKNKIDTKIAKSEREKKEEEEKENKNEP